MRIAAAIAITLLVWLVATYADAMTPTDGAREGEDLPARIERLREEIRERQVALRLSIAEFAVNRGRR